MKVYGSMMIEAVLSAESGNLMNVYVLIDFNFIGK